MSKHKPELILNNFNTRLGHSVGRVFASLFPHDPQFQGRRVVTFHNQRDFIFFRHHRFVYFCLILSMSRLCLCIISTIFFWVLSELMKKFTKWSCLIFFFGRYVFRNNKRVGLKELGPRFTLKLRSLQKGTFDSKYGEYEWVHKVGIVFSEVYVLL